MKAIQRYWWGKSTGDKYILVGITALAALSMAAGVFLGKTNAEEVPESNITETELLQVISPLNQNQETARFWLGKRRGYENISLDKSREAYYSEEEFSRIKEEADPKTQIEDLNKNYVLLVVSTKTRRGIEDAVKAYKNLKTVKKYKLYLTKIQGEFVVIIYRAPYIVLVFSKEEIDRKGAKQLANDLKKQDNILDVEEFLIK